MAWQSYRELIVWQKSMDLVDEVYRLIKMLPREELFALSDQMRRSAISIPSNIAEGHGRQSAKEFRHFLSISKGSVSELETQLLICIRQKYFSEQQVHTALSLCEEVSKILVKIILNTKKEF
ncbi:MAG: four helix bundle protein [Ruminococcus sp.]